MHLMYDDGPGGNIPARIQDRWWTMIRAINRMILVVTVVLATAICACSGSPAPPPATSAKTTTDGPDSCPKGKHWHREIKKCLPNKGVAVPD